MHPPEVPLLTSHPLKTNALFKKVRNNDVWASTGNSSFIQNVCKEKGVLEVERSMLDHQHHRLNVAVAINFWSTIRDVL